MTHPETDTPQDALDDDDEAPGSDSASVDGAEGATGIGGPGLSAEIPDTLAGQRLDKALAALFGDLSRARLQALVQAGHVTRDGVPVTTASIKVAVGDRVQVTLPPPVAAAPQPEAIPLSIVFEDPHLLVVDKPAGMVVHPAAGHTGGTLVNALLHHCRGGLSGIGGVLRPGIVHRLDKETSGLIVVAKSDAAHAGLAAQFADRSLSRTYCALSRGIPTPATGTIDAPIGRHPADRQRMAVRASGGKPAITHYRVEEPFRAVPAARLTCTLETGRTHQIRVHLAALGFPLIGDPVYGPRPGRLNQGPVDRVATTLGRQALHAMRLACRHPISGRMVEFDSPMPRDLSDAIEILRGQENC